MVCKPQSGAWITPSGQEQAASRLVGSQGLPQVGSWGLSGCWHLLALASLRDSGQALRGGTPRLASILSTKPGAGIERILILPLHNQVTFLKKAETLLWVCPAGNSSVRELKKALKAQVALPCLPQPFRSAHLAVSHSLPF